MKRYVVCGECSIGGHGVVLGAFTEDDQLHVMRNRGLNIFTVIKGDFDVYCGRCGAKALVKETEDFNNGFIGTVRFSIGQIVGTV